MKQLLFLFLFPCLGVAQYTGNGNQKITLGEQTTADGLVFRGVASIDTVTATSKITRANKQDTSAFLLLDTVTNLLWHYKTGSNGWIQAGGGVFDTTSIKYVNTYGTQTVNGAKTFTSAVTATRFDPTSSSATGTGMFAPTSTSIGFSTANTEKMILTSNGLLGLGVTPSTWTAGGKNIEIGAAGNIIQAQLGQMAFINNATFNSGWKYSNTGGASFELITNGEYQWFNASSGTAGNPITFTQAMTLKSNSELQIAGTTDRGAYNLQVNGTGVWGEGAYVNGSDANIKENIVDLDSSLNIVNNLKPVIFNYINTSVNNDTKHLGFIAQDVYQILENKDYLNSIVRSDGETLSIAYSNFIPLLTKAIQEQNVLIKALEQRLLILENK